MNTKKILLAGQIALSIGYLQAYLENKGCIVESLLLDEALPLHPDSFNNIENVQNELLGSIAKFKYKKLSLYILKKINELIKDRKNFQKMVASIFTEGLFWEGDREFFLLKQQQRHNNSILGANKIALQKIYPTILNIWNNTFYVMKDIIKKFNPDIIGLQINPLDRFSLFKLIEQIHQEYPDIDIIVGGIYPTVMYAQLLERYPFLIVIRGEGEKTISELVSVLPDRGILSSIPGLSFMDKQNLIVTSDRILIERLDDLPFPKHEIVCNGKQPQDMLWVLTARGCPFKCSFCALKTISHNRTRVRSIDNIMQELEYIKKKFPKVKKIRISDDSFLLDNARVIEFCDEIVRRDLRFEFICSGRAKPISEVMLKKMEAAGFVQVIIGLESGSDEILHKAHKGITKKDMLQAMQLFSRTNIEVQLNLIVGLPGETRSTIKETALFVQKLQKIKYIFKVYTGIASVYPDTELYEKMKIAGVLSDDIWLQEQNIPRYTLEHDEETLWEMYRELEAYVCMDQFVTLKGFWRQWHVLLFTKNRIKVWKAVFKNI